MTFLLSELLNNSLKYLNLFKHTDSFRNESSNCCDEWSIGSFSQLILIHWFIHEWYISAMCFSKMQSGFCCGFVGGRPKLDTWQYFVQNVSWSLLTSYLLNCCCFFKQHRNIPLIFETTVLLMWYCLNRLFVYYITWRNDHLILMALTQGSFPLQPAAISPYSPRPVAHWS